MSVTERVLASCPLVRGHKGACRWCGGALPPRCRQWCSDDCQSDFRANHDWNAARARAVARARRCCVCGAGGHNPIDEWLRLATRIHRQGTRFDGWRAAPRVVAYRDRTRRALSHASERHRRTRALEVNHRAPVGGKHAQFGCHHHQDGLEVLCHACHVAVTTAQRALGWREVDAAEVVAARSAGRASAWL